MLTSLNIIQLNTVHHLNLILTLDQYNHALAHGKSKHLNPWLIRHVSHIANQSTCSSFFMLYHLNLMSILDQYNHAPAYGKPKNLNPRLIHHVSHIADQSTCSPFPMLTIMQIYVCLSNVRSTTTILWSMVDQT